MAKHRANTSPFLEAFEAGKLKSVLIGQPDDVSAVGAVCSLLNGQAKCQLAKTARVESCRARNVPQSDFLDLVRPRYGEQKSAVFKGFEIMGNRPFQR
jgi:hypothetical protein